MFAPKESFTSQQQEISHLSSETHKAYVLQEHPNTTLESATKASLESYATAQAQDFLHETRVLPTHEAERIVLRLRPESHDKKVEELFALMLEKGIKNALDVVKKLGDAHLEDDFHRFLVQYLHTIGAIPGLKSTDPTFKELDHTLFSIALPSSPDQNQDFKKHISAMGQFYTSLVSLVGLENSISIELAVEHARKDIVVYVAVPRIAIDGFEKLVHSFFPGAAVEEMVPPLLHGEGHRHRIALPLEYYLAETQQRVLVVYYQYLFLGHRLSLRSKAVLIMDNILRTRHFCTAQSRQPSKFFRGLFEL